MIRNPIPSSKQMSTYYVDYLTAEQAYFQGDLVDTSNGDKYVWTFRLDIVSRTASYIWEDSLLQTLQKDHELRGFASTTSYMYRVTEGTCEDSSGGTFQGVMLTGVPSPTTGTSWYSTAIELDCAVCIDL